MCANGNGGCVRRESTRLRELSDALLSNLPLITLGAVMTVALLQELLA